MITVKYFAQLKQMAGKDEDQFDLGAQVTLDQLSDAIGTSLPKIGELVREKKIMVSVNYDVVPSDHIIQDGDEVALLPSVFRRDLIQDKGRHMSTILEPKVRIQREDFSVTDEIKALKKSSNNIGGIVVFLGTGRELNKGENISDLNFEHYPKMAEKKLEEIRVQAIEDYKIIDMSIIHRIGHIDIGENIVLIIAAGEHRKEAFDACEWAIAELKRTTPIWKKETTTKGEVWVSATP